MDKLEITGYEIIGNPEMMFSLAAPLWGAENGSITFCTVEKVKNPLEVLKESKASVIIMDKGVDLKNTLFDNKTIILVDKPRETFIQILNAYFPLEVKMGEIHQSAVVDSEADIHPTVFIGPNCTIGKCKIGENTIIHANVAINDCVKIGKNVKINPGCIIGYDGFGYYEDENGDLKNFPHIGGVIIEDDVEMGSNVCIDRGTLGDTIIKKGAKFDNQIHVAHNVVIGENTLIMPFAMMAGSVTIGERAWIAPGATIKDGIKIGNGAFIGLGAVVIRDVPENIVVVGNPARPLPKK